MITRTRNDKKPAIHHVSREDVAGMIGLIRVVRKGRSRARDQTMYEVSVTPCSPKPEEFRIRTNE
jgi:hypothetical protein